MQTHGGAEAEAAILSPERSMVAEIKVDWNRNGQYNSYLSDLSHAADNIVVNRALTGTMPEELMLIEGAAAAELSFDLNDDSPYGGMSWVQVFAPYNALSPLRAVEVIDKEVRYRIGVETPMGVVWYQQFIGNIRTVTPNRADNKVSITALDRVEKLRRPITHTDWAILDQQFGLGYQTAQMLSSSWVIDHCLRFGDTSSSPYRWRTTEENAANGGTTNQLFISGNGGVLPNIGWVDGSSSNTFPNTDQGGPSMYQDHGQPHPSSPDPSVRPQMFRAQGSGATDFGGDVTKYWIADRSLLADLKANRVCLTFTLNTETYQDSDRWSALPDNTMLMRLRLASTRYIAVMGGLGKLWVRFVDTGTSTTFDGTKLSITAGTGFENARFTVKHRRINSTTYGVYIRQHGAGLVDWQTITTSSLSDSMTSSTGLFELWKKLSFGDISIISYNFVDSDPDAATQSARYAAVVDKGLNTLSFLPKRWGSEAWSVITEVAAAEFGAVSWDENGVFRFWNQDTLLSKKDTVVRHLTLDDVGQLEMTSSSDSFRNVFSITAIKKRTQEGRVFQAQGPDELLVRTGQNVDIRVWVENIVTPNSGLAPVYVNSPFTTPPTGYKTWNDQVDFGVSVQFLPASGKWDNFTYAMPNPFDKMFMYRTADGGTAVRVYNGYGKPIRFADSTVNSNVEDITDATPAFRWNGSKLTSFDNQVFALQDNTSVGLYGARTLELSGDWYQEFYTRGTFLSKIIARTSRPIPATDNVQIAGDPRLQLGDTIEIHDPDGMGETIRLQILGINRTFSRDGGLVDDLTVELVRPSDVGLWDSASYVWDSTFKWSD